jgi:hypothetical protein
MLGSHRFPEKRRLTVTILETSATYDPILTSATTMLPPLRMPSRSESAQERFLRALDAHAAAEADSLGQYEALATSTGDPVVGLLMRFIVEDEQRHHRLLEQMATTLRNGLDWTHAPDTLPVGEVAEQEPDLSPAIETTRALIREEREGARFVRHLAHQEPRLYGGLYALILEMIGQDSAKHERLLHYVLKRLEERAAS